MISVLDGFVSELFITNQWNTIIQRERNTGIQGNWQNYELVWTFSKSISLNAYPCKDWTFYPIQLVHQCHSIVKWIIAVCSVFYRFFQELGQQ